MNQQLNHIFVTKGLLKNFVIVNNIDPEKFAQVYNEIGLKLNFNSYNDLYKVDVSTLPGAIIEKTPIDAKKDHSEKLAKLLTEYSSNPQEWIDLINKTLKKLGLH